MKKLIIIIMLSLVIGCASSTPNPKVVQEETADTIMAEYGSGQAKQDAQERLGDESTGSVKGLIWFGGIILNAFLWF